MLDRLKNLFSRTPNVPDDASPQKPATPKTIPDDFDTTIDQLVDEARETNQYIYGKITFSGSTTYQKVKNWPAERKVRLIPYCIDGICQIRAQRKRPNTYSSSDPSRLLESVLDSLLSSVLRTKIEFTDQQLIELLESLRRAGADKRFYQNFSRWPVGFTVIQFEKHAKRVGVSPVLKAFIHQALDWPEFGKASHNYYGSDVQKARQKLAALVHEAAEGADSTPPYELPEDDIIGKRINEHVRQLEPQERPAFYKIFQLALTATSGKPTKKFLAAAKDSVAEANPARFKPAVHEWLNYLSASNPIEEERVHRWGNHEYRHIVQVFLSEKNAILIKGLVWMLSQFHDEATLAALAQLAERSFKKIPGLGPTCAGVGNACLYSLAHSKGLVGISHLSRLKLKVTQASTRQLINRYLDEGSAKRGISPSELEELAVPDFGLTLGVREEPFDEYTLRLSLTGVGKTQLQWIKPDGSPQKTPPAFIKQSKKLSDRLKKLKDTVTQIQKYSTAQRDRIDRSYIEDRQWGYESFQKYYLDHGLVSVIARKLIWILEIDGTSLSALYRDDRWEDIAGNELLGITPATGVRLWHPILVSQTEVLQWRLRLEELQIQQPSKQAYREVYLVTEAELNTRVYSNRMAAHLIKQHQFNALAGIRGWKYTLLGAFDHGMDGSKASIELPTHKIRCEFWIEELYIEHEMSDAGIWNYVSTDQVRFIDQSGEPMNMIDVPKLVFSEMMRDVDLFVGVCSVGNDPEWHDRGTTAQHRHYWTSYSFGSLNEVAKTRKAVLERLLPRLKIADKVSIDGKFVRVKGSVREYKIHIGSANILMEPNDQYLCIVPARGIDATPDKLYLPFEGDRALSLIISKAVLLAEDHKITDKTILSQIRR